MHDDRGSDRLVDMWLKGTKDLTREDLREVVDHIRSMGAECTMLTRSGDDYCGNGKYPIGPKGPGPMGELVTGLVTRGWCVEVFPRGIPVFDEVLFNFNTPNFKTPAGL